MISEIQNHHIIINKNWLSDKACWISTTIWIMYCYLGILWIFLWWFHVECFKTKYGHSSHALTLTKKFISRTLWLIWIFTNNATKNQYYGGKWLITSKFEKGSFFNQIKKIFKLKWLSKFELKCIKNIYRWKVDMNQQNNCCEWSLQCQWCDQCNKLSKYIKNDYNTYKALSCICNLFT
jgi:hypothetical protein